MDWSHILKTLNLPGAFGVWHLELEGPRVRHCSEIMPVGGPPSSGRTRWQDWPRYGNRIHGYLRAGPTTMVPGVKSFLSTISQVELSHPCLCPTSHMPCFYPRTCAFPLLSSAPVLPTLIRSCWGLCDSYVESCSLVNPQHLNIIFCWLTITSHKAWHTVNTEWVFSKWMN